MTQSFRYKLPWVLKSAFWGVLALLLLFSFAQLLSKGQPQQLFSWQSLQLFGLLLLASLLFVYAHLFNESIQTDEQSLHIKRRLGKDTLLAYSDIHRLILRQQKNKHSDEEWQLHLYSSDSKRVATIYLNDLVAANEFEALIEDRAKTYKIPLIRQDEEGVETF